MTFDHWANGGNKNTMQLKGGLPRSQKHKMERLEEMMTARIA